MATEFEWDAAKAQRNHRKHGVAVEEAASAFYDALSITIPDPDHSVREHRFQLIGMASTGRLVVVSHTERGDRIRIISARRANRRERTSYEKT